jgi:GTPase SAR1 family protein
MKIGLCGTISVGKTTLVKELIKLPKFQQYTISTERSKYLRDLGIPLNTDSTINGQIIFLAERSNELLNQNLITDRTIIDVIAFSNLAKSIKNEQKVYFERLAISLLEQYDYIFYVSPEGVKLENNGVRIVDYEYRILIDNEINRLLSLYLSGKYYTLKGTTEKRIKQIEDIIK